MTSKLVSILPFTSIEPEAALAVVLGLDRSGGQSGAATTCERRGAGLRRGPWTASRCLPDLSSTPHHRSRTSKLLQDAAVFGARCRNLINRNPKKVNLPILLGGIALGLTMSQGAFVIYMTQHLPGPRA